ncbi:MAG: hypothetical protein NZ519_03485 [Bacteroidia bacterium]|nr:hypothetical protein [Bacteroidia bacterium]
MGIRCAHAHKVGVLRATCGMPRPLRSKGHAQKKIKYLSKIDRKDF